MNDILTIKVFLKRLISVVNSMNINILLIKLWRYLYFSLILFVLFSVSGVITYRFIPVPFTPLMFERFFEKAGKSQNINIKQKWVPLKKMSPNIIIATIAAEDNNFVYHFGIDFKAIHEAYKFNKQGRKIRGASTISQQTSKNVFLWLGRNYLRKGLEFYYTILIEIFWGKERIMEVYLNSIEMGDGIYGIEAASETYFHKHAMQLNRGEAALIAATFPDPRNRNPAYPNKYLIHRKQVILSIMDNIGTAEFVRKTENKR